MNGSLWKIIETGGVAMWFIIALSVLVIAVSAERIAAMWSFMSRARTLADTVIRCVGRGAIAEARTACERSKSPIADIFLIGFERLGRSSPEAVQAAVDRERQRLALSLKTRLWILGTVGATAPFIGLYGTVVGIMAAFTSIDATGGGFNHVSKGLSEALITTAAGIVVAVEAVAVYNFFNQRMARMNTEIKILVEEFLESLLLGGNVAEEKDGHRQAAR